MLELHCHAKSCPLLLSNKFCRHFLPIDCIECRPATHRWPMDEFWADDHQITAGDDSFQPVAFPSIQRNNSETLAVFREAEQGKQRQITHGSEFPSKTEHALH